MARSSLSLTLTLCSPLSSSANLSPSSVSVMKSRTSKSDTSKENKVVIKCDQCDYKSDRSSNLRRHVASLHQEQSITCCGQIFKTKFEMMDHRAAQHKGALTCPHCDQVFNLFASFSRHIKNHDPTAKKYVCEKCNKYTTTSKFNLERHTTSCGSRKRRSSVETIDDYTDEPLDLSEQMDFSEPLDLSVRSSLHSINISYCISSEDSLPSHESYTIPSSTKRRKSASSHTQEKDNSSPYNKTFPSLIPTVKPQLNHFTRYAVRFIENKNEMKAQEIEVHQPSQECHQLPPKDDFMAHLGLVRKTQNQ